jgi:hypothetical protein
MLNHQRQADEQNETEMLLNFQNLKARGDTVVLQVECD